MPKKVLYVPENVEIVRKSWIVEPYFAEVFDFQDFPENVYVGGHDFHRVDFLNMVRAIAICGYKVNAIILIRGFTGWGLRDSKEFVEKLMESEPLNY